jgi:hypothetical protein
VSGFANGVRQKRLFRIHAPYRFPLMNSRNLITTVRFDDSVSG